MAQYKEVKRNGSGITVPFDLSVEVDLGSRYVDVETLEAQMDALLGCTLKRMRLGGGKGQVDICQQYVGRYSHDIPYHALSQVSEACFAENDAPSSMFYEDGDALVKDILTIYQLSYFHYILGKRNKMKGSFPSYCCGQSSKNLITAMWEAGIVAAVIVRSNRYDHTYLAVPFVVKGGTEGIILVDPTSDQLINDSKKKVRNSIQILPAIGWEYRTDWRGGRNLYPEEVETSSCTDFSEYHYDEFIKTALANPVIVV